MRALRLRLERSREAARRLRAVAFSIGAMALAIPAMAEPVAVIIANPEYRKLSPITTGDIAASLTGAFDDAGFRVIVEKNATTGEILAALRFLRAESGQADTVVFYFMGYVRQLNGKNFLIPVTADPRSAFDMLTQAIDFGSVRDAMRDAGGRLSIAIIDGAYPEATLDAIEGLGPGLAVEQAGSGEVILLGAPAEKLLSPDARPQIVAQAIERALANANRPVGTLMASIVAEASVSPARSGGMPINIGPDVPGDLIPEARTEPVAQPAPEPEPAPETTEDQQGYEATTWSPSTSTAGTRPANTIPAPSRETSEPEPEEQTARVAPNDPEAQMDGPAFEATLSEGRLRLIQIALRNIGLYKGPIDADFGPQTREAILIYQRSRGLDPTGFLTKVQMLTLFEVGGV